MDVVWTYSYCSSLIITTLTGQIHDRFFRMIHIHLSIPRVLGQEVVSALLPLHVLIGCDIRGTFSGISKDFWTGRFLSERNNRNFSKLFLSLHSCRFEKVMPEISKCICQSYRPQKNITKSHESRDIISILQGEPRNKQTSVISQSIPSAFKISKFSISCMTFS